MQRAWQDEATILDEGRILLHFIGDEVLAFMSLLRLGCPEGSVRVRKPLWRFLCIVWFIRQAFLIQTVLGRPVCLLVSETA